MKERILTLGLLLVCLSGFSQNPLRHYFYPVKGNVVKVEKSVYEEVTLNADGSIKPLTPAFIREVAELENGQPVRQFFYDRMMNKSKENLSGRYDLVYENGFLKSLKEYSSNPFSTKGTMRLHASFMLNYNEGVLSTENRLDEKGKLQASYTYHPVQLLEGTPLYVFDELVFENGEMKPRDQYGIQYDQDGQTKLHFQIRKQDTVFYTRISKISAEGYHLENFSDGNFNELDFERRIKRDKKGNITQILVIATDKDGSKKYGATLIRYQYKGDPEWPKEADTVIVEEKTGLGGIVPPVSEMVEPAPIKEPEVVEAPARPSGKQSASKPAITAGNKEVPRYFFPYSKVEKNGKFGCVDAYKRTMIPEVYDYISPFSAYEGYILVQKDKLWGAVDPENRVVIPIQYKTIYADSKDVLILVDTAGNMGVSDYKGSVVLPCSYEKISYAAGNKVLRVQAGGKTGIFAESGREILPIKYDDLRYDYFKSDLFAASFEGRWGVIDSTQKVLIPFQYEDMELLEFPMDVDGKKERYFRVKKDGVWGAVNQQNNTIVPFDYQYIGACADRKHFMVKRNNKDGVITQDLQVVIPLEFVKILQPDVRMFMPINEQGLAGLRTPERIIFTEKYPREKIEIRERIVRVTDGEQGVLYSIKGEFEMVEYSKYEAVPDAGRMSGDIYYLTNGQKWLVSQRDKCPAAELFDQYELKTIGKDNFMVLQRIDSSGKTLFGLRDARSGQCITELQYTELDFNVTMRHKGRFKEVMGGRSEFVVAVGRTSAKSKWELIGSEGNIVEVK